MEYAVALDYYEAITVLEAQEALVAMNIQDYPRMKTEGRSRFYREMRKKAYPQHLQRQMSFEEFAKQVGMLDG